MRHVAPSAGSISVVPAGSPAQWRWSGRKDSLHFYLEPALVARVGAEAFDLDLARLTLPPLDGLDLPHLRAAMWAVDAELTAGGAGGRLAAESLANVLAVHLIRHVLAPRRPERWRAGRLPQGPVRAIVEYVEEHLDASLTLEQMAAVVHLSPYHFAAVQGRHRAAAAPVRHPASRRAGEAAPARRRRLLPGGGRRARRLRGPEPLLPSLQAPRRRHAGSVPDARKNRLNGRKSRQETGRRTPYHSSCGRPDCATGCRLRAPVRCLDPLQHVPQSGRGSCGRSATPSSRMIWPRSSGRRPQGVLCPRGEGPPEEVRLRARQRTRPVGLLEGQALKHEGAR
jgi:hypothetical protein